MTNEEMQKTMQFILEQQAQFVVDIQKLQETHTQTENLVQRLAVFTVKGFEDTDAKINALIDAQMRTDENLNRTDEAVRNLTAVADRYFRERNGQKDSQ